MHCNAFRGMFLNENRKLLHSTTTSGLFQRDENKPHVQKCSNTKWKTSCFSIQLQPQKIWVENIYFFFRFLLHSCLCILIYSVNLVFCNSNRKIENKMLDENSLHSRKLHVIGIAGMDVTFFSRHIMIYGQFQWYSCVSLSSCVLFNERVYVKYSPMLICE